MPVGVILTWEKVLSYPVYLNRSKTLLESIRDAAGMFCQNDQNSRRDVADSDGRSVCSKVQVPGGIPHWLHKCACIGPPTSPLRSSSRYASSLSLPRTAFVSVAATTSSPIFAGRGFFGTGCDPPGLGELQFPGDVPSRLLSGPVDRSRNASVLACQVSVHRLTVN